MTPAVTMRSGRPGRRIPAVITGAVALLLAVFVAWAALARLLTQRWPLLAERVFTELGSAAWVSAAGWGLGAALVVVGLLLVLAAVLPQRKHVLGLASPESPHVRDGAAFVTTRGLGRLAAARVRDIDGVDRVDVVVRGRRLRARVVTSLTDAAGLRSAVHAAVTAQLQEVGITPAPKIAIKTAHREVRS